jgi:azurin
MKKIHTLTLALAAGALLLAGCGKKDDAAASGGANAAASANAVATLELTANDSMKFNVTRFEVKAGQDVKVILTNIGSMPKQAMGHNFVLLKKSAEVETFDKAAIAAAATDYIPANLQDQIIAHTKLLGPKQTDEITFKAPTEPGEYVYLCSFPAHYQAGMKGVLVVK